MSDIQINKNSRHKIKDDKWHILNRPGMYIGSVTEAEYQEYLLENNVMSKKDISYSPALVKLINEVIDNSVDILVGKKGGVVKVNLTNISARVEDNGTGIPVEYIEDLDGSHIITPKAMWGRAKAGSNFNGDAQDETTIGTNGVGSFCANVFSNKFIGTTCDGKKAFVGVWQNNCENYNENISDTKSRGTIVYFEPDLKRLGLTEISQNVFRIIKQRLINLKISHPSIRFFFNDEEITYTRKEFIASFGTNGNVYEEANYSICVLPTDTDDFASFSLVNGLNIKSGSHIEYILKYVQAEIKDKLPKKFEKIKPGDIKNKLKIIFIGTGFPELEWEGQTKESIKNPDKQIRAYLGDDWKDILPKIAKNKNIINPITFLFEAKMSANDRAELEGADKELKKKATVKKFRPAFKYNRFLALIEGDSALKGIIPALGREEISYLPLRGVVINVVTNKLSKVANNEEYQDVMKVLELKFSADNSCDNMTHDYVVIMTDADVDGAHIRGLLFGFFHKFVPDIFEKKKILIFRTPIKVAKDAKENMVAAFLTEAEYRTFAADPANKKYTIEYKKGLGSMNPKEYAQFFQLRPFEECLTELKINGDSFELMNKWLADDSDFRKEKMQNRLSNFNVDAI